MTSSTGSTQEISGVSDRALRSAPIAYVISSVEQTSVSELFELIEGLGIQTLVDVRREARPLRDGAELSEVILGAGYGYLPRTVPAEGDRAIELLAELAPVLTLCDSPDRPAVDDSLSRIRRLEVDADGSLHTISERLQLSESDT